MLDLVDVVVDVRVRGTQPSYSYRVPPHLAGAAVPGVLVVVSFHGRAALGYVVERRRSTPADLGFDPASLKPLVGIARGARLNAELLSLIRFAAEEYGGPLWLALHSAVPQSSRSRLRPFWELADAGAEADPTTPEAVLLDRLREGEAADRQLRSRFGEEGAKALERLRRRGVVRKGWEMLAPPIPRAGTQPYRVAPAEALRSFSEGNRRRPAQAAAAERLLVRAGELLTTAKLKELGINAATRDKLVAAGLLAAEGWRQSFLGTAPADDELLAGQVEALAAVREALREGRPDGFLLHGVTASGKTEVYLRAAAECLSLGRTVLLLVPEIALAGQVVERVRERFGEAVAVLHSGLTASQRYGQWQRIARGDTPIVVGPRSAVFAPLPALGLIVIDEEHEGAYKQGGMLRYDARTVAAKRARDAGAVLLRGSATPSVDVYYRAHVGGLARIEMPERVSRRGPPAFEVLDLRDLRPEKHSISEPLRQAVGETLGRGEQAILFLNRRAFAPFLLCRDCGHVPECERCSVSLAFHRRRGVLRCHHCGLQRKPPDTCPKCRGRRLLPFGLGTQRVEEDLGALFPDAGVGRLDRDTLGADEVLAEFRQRKLNLLVGTQIVAKGLDFPDVSLVGVVSADTGLHLPDFQAAERTFQLLVQVAGRAGRARIPGRVIVQTFSPEHPAIRFAATYDYQGFYRWEIAIREAAGYPPFRRLAHLLVSHQDRAQAQGEASRILGALAKAGPAGLELLGPAPSIPERVRGAYRWSLLMKMPPEARPGPLITQVLNDVSPCKADVTVDVDPQNLD
jgi:primosomal protein N' (replication factor Y)